MYRLPPSSIQLLGGMVTTVQGAGIASREGGYLVNKRVNLGMLVQPRRERRLPRKEDPMHHIFLRLPDELFDGALLLPDRGVPGIECTVHEGQVWYR